MGLRRFSGLAYSLRTPDETGDEYYDSRVARSSAFAHGYLSLFSQCRPTLRFSCGAQRRPLQPVVGPQLHLRNSPFVFRTSAAGTFAQETITSAKGRRIDMGMDCALPKRMARSGRRSGIPSQAAKAGRTSGTSIGIFR